MGSRRTHEDRLARLREVGLTSGELARLRSPIGLDLGARTPEGTAVAIAAELIQLRWGGTGMPLTGTTGRLHHGKRGGAPRRPRRRPLPRPRRPPPRLRCRAPAKPHARPPRAPRTP